MAGAAPGTKYLIHADGALPNLALMRLAAYFRAWRHEVRLVRAGEQPRLDDDRGEVYGSSIFQFSAKARAAMDAKWGRIIWGGTGVRVDSSLSEIDSSADWDALPPDYSIYPGEERSIGFTQRGCRLKCKFCVVPQKEGAPRSVQPISGVNGIWRGRPHHRKILLLDNDFFGQAESDWRARIEEIREGDFKVCFTQGLNIRMIDEVSAQAIAQVEYRDNDFRNRVLYTAWDNLGDERIFKRGVETLERAGVPAKHLRVYMLVGYAKNETWEQIHHRFDELVALGCEPYPMVYDARREDLKAFQRWAVRGLYRAVPWESYRDPRLDRVMKDARRARTLERAQEASK